MQHLNGNMICSIDTETTGLDPKFHEIWQIAILALDSNLKPRKDIMPFYILMKPSTLAYVDWDVPVFKHNKKKILEASLRGHDPMAATELLREWIERLDLPVTKSGMPKRITPLGQNYGFDKGFIQQWLGVEQYEEWFDYHNRDTMSAALYLNDRAAFHAEKVPFSKVNLSWLCSQLGVETPTHDALADCRATAEVYRKLVNQGLMR